MRIGLIKVRRIILGLAVLSLGFLGTLQAGGKYSGKGAELEKHSYQKTHLENPQLMRQVANVIIGHTTKKELPHAREIMVEWKPVSGEDLHFKAESVNEPDAKGLVVGRRVKGTIHFKQKLKLTSLTHEYEVDTFELTDEDFTEPLQLEP